MKGLIFFFKATWSYIDDIISIIQITMTWSCDDEFINIFQVSLK